jgi:hypothetical protein
MTLAITEYKYISIDDRNVPFIAGTTMKVVELANCVQYLPL